MLYLFNLLFSWMPCILYHVLASSIIYIPTNNITYQGLLAYIFDTKIMKIPRFCVLFRPPRKISLCFVFVTFVLSLLMPFFPLQKMSLQGPFQELCVCCDTLEKRSNLTLKWLNNVAFLWNRSNVNVMIRIISCLNRTTKWLNLEVGLYSQNEIDILLAFIRCTF